MPSRAHPHLGGTFRVITLVLVAALLSASTSQLSQFGVIAASAVADFGVMERTSLTL